MKKTYNEHEKPSTVCIDSLKNKKGITLVALVITIIIMIILAYISIMMLKNIGLIDKTQEAKQKHVESVAKEKLENALLEANIRKNTDGNYNSENFLSDLLENEGFVVNQNIIIVDGIRFVIDREKLRILDNINTDTENNYIQEWLKVGNLDKEYKYTTIQEILNDQICLEKLMNNINTIDYMMTDTGQIMNKICESKIGLEYIAKNEYAKYSVIKNKMWCESILKSEYESIFSSKLLSVSKVENMTLLDESGLFSTNQNDLMIYSSGKGGDPSFLGEATKHLPLLFDGSEETYWSSRTTNTSIYPARIGIYSEEPLILYKVVLKIENGNKFNKGAVIQSSSNLKQWEDICEYANYKEGEYIISDLKREDRNAFVLYIPSITNSEQSANIYKLQFYYMKMPHLANKDIVEWLSKINVNLIENEEVELNNYISKLMKSKEAVEYMIRNENIMDLVTNNRTYMRCLSESQYAKYKAITNTVFYDKIMNSRYIDTFDNSNITVPKITNVKATNDANIYKTNIVGVDIYSSGKNGDPAFNGQATTYLTNMFDNDNKTSWCSRTTTNCFPARIGIILDKKLICYKIKINNTNISKLNNGFCIQASNDLQNWENLTEYIKNGDNLLKSKSFNEYKDFVCYIPSIISNSNSFCINELQFYCVEKSE